MARVLVPSPSPPTPIYVSKRARGLFVFFAIAAPLVVLWRAPEVLSVTLGGLAMAVILAFSVRALARVMPRAVAVTLSFCLLLAAIVALALWIGPVIVPQLGSLLGATPDFVHRLGNWLPRFAQTLARKGLLLETPDEFVTRIQNATIAGVQNFTRYLLGQVGGIVSGTVGVFVALFGVIFVAGYLLSDARRIHATILRSTPDEYRHDARDLWNAFGYTLSRYLGGLTLSVVIEGGLAAIALYALGVPYAALIGVWVSVLACGVFTAGPFFRETAPSIKAHFRTFPATTKFSECVAGVVSFDRSNLAEQFASGSL